LAVVEVGTNDQRNPAQFNRISNETSIYFKNQNNVNFTQKTVSISSGGRRNANWPLKKGRDHHFQLHASALNFGSKILHNCDKVGKKQVFFLNKFAHLIITRFCFKI
jgi:hypothetical protein